MAASEALKATQCLICAIRPWFGWLHLMRHSLVLVPQKTFKFTMVLGWSGSWDLKTFFDDLLQDIVGHLWKLFEPFTRDQAISHVELSNIKVKRRRQLYAVNNLTLYCQSSMLYYLRFLKTGLWWKSQRSSTSQPVFSLDTCRCAGGAGLTATSSYQGSAWLVAVWEVEMSDLRSLGAILECKPSCVETVV